MDLEITMEDPQTLILDPGNVRGHNERNLNAIVKSLKQFGVRRPIVAKRGTNVVYAGNGVLQAACKLGLSQIPVAWIPEDTPETVAKAYAIADNRTTELSEWDLPQLEAVLGELKELDVELADLGFEADDLNSLFVDNGNKLAVEDDYEIGELPEAKSQTGDLWTMGRHKVLCGDCTDSEVVGRLANGNMASLMVTDPPYGVSYADKNKFLNSIDEGNRIQHSIENDHNSVDEMAVLWKAAFGCAYEVCSDGAPYYICSPQGGDLMMMMMMMIQESGWLLKHSIIWSKNNHVLGRSDYHYKHEPMLYGWKDGGHKFYGGTGEVSVWQIDKPVKNELHPTMKPVELFGRAIGNSSREHEVVIDPFLGSGTTLIACQQLDRVCYGIEIEPVYVDVAVNRFVEFVGSSDNVKCLRDQEQILYEKLMNN